MALSANDLLYIRNQIGDSSTSPLVTDTDMNYYYDNRVTATDSNEKLDQTVVWSLRQLKAKLQSHVAQTHSETGVTKQGQQHFEHVCTSLVSWEKRMGMSGGKVIAGSINLGIDEEDSEVSIS